MLTLTGSGHNRREFLRIGGLALGGLTLPQLLAAKAAAGELGNVLKDKAVVFLFMQGGPPQTELFDPKLTAPSGVCSATGETKTTLPGVTYGGTMTKLAKWAHKTAVVRSFRTGNGNHDIKPIVCEDTLGANIGSIYARIAGANRPSNGMPTNVALFPRSVDPETGPAITSFGKFTATGPLSKAYAPFVPGGDGEAQQNMTLRMERDRLDDRRSLLTRLDDIRRNIDATGLMSGMDEFQVQAFDTIMGGVADAFDLSKEDPRVVAAYDTAPLIDPANVSTRWNNHKHYKDHIKTLGKLMLMARRLVERGVGFVTVTTSFVWDFHADSNNATLTEGMEYVGNPFDHAAAAFIEDCERRGLGEKVLLVCCGEMGRTPRINSKGGRDHWGNLSPLLLYGGGLKMGQVIGQSTKDAGEPLTTPVTMQDLIGTVMHTLFDVGQLRLDSGVPREIMSRIQGYEPIKELV
jgi:Protein of unknown function (DUF1501)